MRKIRQIVLGIAVLAMMALSPGCVSYDPAARVNNSLEGTEGVPLDQAWVAANHVFNDLNLPITASQKDAGLARLETHDPQNQPIIVELLRQGGNATEIDVTVGAADSPENRTAERMIYDHIKSRF